MCVVSAIYLPVQGEGPCGLRSCGLDRRGATCPCASASPQVAGGKVMAFKPMSEIMSQKSEIARKRLKDSLLSEKSAASRLPPPREARVGPLLVAVAELTGSISAPWRRWRAFLRRVAEKRIERLPPPLLAASLLAALPQSVGKKKSASWLTVVAFAMRRLQMRGGCGGSCGSMAGWVPCVKGAKKKMQALNRC